MKAILVLLLAVCLLHCGNLRAQTTQLGSSKIWKVVGAIEKERTAVTVDKLSKLTGHSLPVDPGSKANPSNTFFSAKSSWDCNEFARVEFRGEKKPKLILLETKNDPQITSAAINKRFGKPSFITREAMGPLHHYKRTWGMLEFGFTPKGVLDVITFQFN